MAHQDLPARIEAALAAGHVLPRPLDYTTRAPPTRRPRPSSPSSGGTPTSPPPPVTPRSSQFSDGANLVLLRPRPPSAWSPPGATAGRPRPSATAAARPASSRSFSRHYEGKDRGHFLSHGQGGLMDVNFFPRRSPSTAAGAKPASSTARWRPTPRATPGRSPSPGRSTRGDNDTWDPEQVEYGLLLRGERLRVVDLPQPIHHRRAPSSAKGGSGSSRRGECPPPTPGCTTRQGLRRRRPSATIPVPLRGGAAMRQMQP